MALMASNIPEDYISPSRIMAFYYGGEMGPHFMDVLRGSGEIERMGWARACQPYHHDALNLGPLAYFPAD